MNINNKNDTHREISERIANGNKCYYSNNNIKKEKILQVQIVGKRFGESWWKMH